MAEKLPEVQFHIIGGREQDVSYYKSQAASKNIVFYGYVSQVEAQNYAHQCDVLLAPYQKDITIEGRICKAADYMSPLKIFEYMSHGKAILCSDFPVLREVLNKDCAMLLPWDSPDSWCLAMKTLLRDPLLMKRLGDKVLAKFVSQYTWEKRAESVLYGLK
jgi:glycosyltransferase involved in cell wall biosynthesis